MFLVVAFGVLLAAPAIMAQEKKCQPGTVREEGSFWYECIGHPRLGGYEEAKGCLFEGKRVLFGVVAETEVDNDPLHGFVQECAKEGTRFMKKVTGCWSYDLTQNKNVRVNAGESIVVEDRMKGLKMKFSCKREPNGAVSYNVKPAN